MSDTSFSELAVLVHGDKAINLNNLTVQELMNHYEWDVQYSYAQKIVAFVRQLKDNCFFSLPDGVQKTIVWIEDNYAYDMLNKDIANEIGVSNYHVRLAKTFLEMENLGYFDNADAYNLVQ